MAKQEHIPFFRTYCRLHVHKSASNLEVIRKAQKKLNKKSRYSRECRTDRHKFYRYMLAHHNAAHY